MNSSFHIKTPKKSNPNKLNITRKSISPRNALKIDSPKTSAQGMHASGQSFKINGNEPPAKIKIHVGDENQVLRRVSRDEFQGGLGHSDPNGESAEDIATAEASKGHSPVHSSQGPVAIFSKINPQSKHMQVETTSF